MSVLHASFIRISSQNVFQQYAEFIPRKTYKKTESYYTFRENVYRSRERGSSSS